MIRKLDDLVPDYRSALFIASSAEIIGNVTLATLSSVWFSAVLRGDLASIGIGEGTNIQDGAVVHVDIGAPASIGTYVTVGHQAIVHGCTIEDGVLIGMGSRILNHAVIQAESIVGAGALVPPGKTYPPRSLLVGVPAKAVRTVTDEEIAEIRANAERYIKNARRYSAELAEIE